MSEPKKTKKSPRRRAREFAVQALYQTAINKIPAEEVAKNTREHTDFKNADDELFTASNANTCSKYARIWTAMKI